jgi:putative ABC transport system ATP-binding protein
MVVIELSELRYCWPKQTRDALYIPHLQVKQGEHVFIKGASGSGKTTLLNLLAGILTPGAGSIQLLGQALERLSGAQRDRLRAEHMGVIFQQFNLLPYLSVRENIQLPCEFSAKRKRQAGNLSISTAHLLQQLGLDAGLEQRAVTDLSVGQQQRVAVARALMGSPELIIADEPTSALDTDMRDSFLKLLFQQAEAQQSTIVFVSHDPYIAPYFPRVIDLSELNQA